MRKLLWLLPLLAVSCSKYDKKVVHHDLPIIPKSHDAPSSSISHVLYLIQSGKSGDAIDATLAMQEQEPYIFHEGAMKRLGLALIEQGARSRDITDMLTCLYGVGISHDEGALSVVSRAVSFDEPQIQLVAVNVAASFGTQEAIDILEQAMKSNYIIVRLEAAYWLSLKRSDSAHAQLVALMSKVDPQLHELFPQLFVIEGSQGSMDVIKKLLYDQNENVRREAILAIANARRDDFLQDIRLLIKEPSHLQQEAVRYGHAGF